MQTRRFRGCAMALLVVSVASVPSVSSMIAQTAEPGFQRATGGGEQMYEALRSVGTPAELIVYPGQFHGFTRPSYIKDRYQYWFDWYDEDVRGVEKARAAGVAAAE